MDLTRSAELKTAIRQMESLRTAFHDNLAVCDRYELNAPKTRRVYTKLVWQSASIIAYLEDRLAKVSPVRTCADCAAEVFGSTETKTGGGVTDVLPDQK